MPQRKNGEAFLSDRDRGGFQENGHELAPTSRRMDASRSSISYLMMAKPSRALCSPMPACLPDGKSQRPSSLMGEVESCFQNENPG